MQLMGMSVLLRWRQLQKTNFFNNSEFNVTIVELVFNSVLGERRFMIVPLSLWCNLVSNSKLICFKMLIHLSLFLCLNVFFINYGR